MARRVSGAAINMMTLVKFIENMASPSRQITLNRGALTSFFQNSYAFQAVNLLDLALAQLEEA
jgi:hypothetical protein